MHAWSGAKEQRGSAASFWKRQSGINQARGNKNKAIICKVVAKLTDDKLAERLSLAAKSCFSRDQLRRLPNLNCSENVHVYSWVYYTHKDTEAATCPPPTQKKECVARFREVKLFTGVKRWEPGSSVGAQQWLRTQRGAHFRALTGTRAAWRPAFFFPFLPQSDHMSIGVWRSCISTSVVWRQMGLLCLATQTEEQKHDAGRPGNPKTRPQGTEWRLGCGLMRWTPHF